ncbi:MAG: hypothetical protein HN576_09495 [Bacteriovoracaceae bacterium]|jgi:hypothetical protein|nr:hypothetical protein [Bacteriovoracaceae bacterium]
MFKFIFFIFLLKLVSCASTKLIAPDLEVIYTNKNKNVGGIVVYNPHGLSTLANARKSEAMTRMRTVCLPAAYEVTKEKMRRVSNVNKKYKGNPELFTGRMVKFLEYSCIY